MIAENDLNFLLQRRSEEEPAGVTYTYLDRFSGGDAPHERPLTNEDLFRRARALAARIQATAQRGDRILILNQPGIDYIVGVYASMLAGMVAVPAYPPEKTRLNRGWERIRAIAQDARPSCVLVDPETLATTGESPWGGQSGVEWIVTSTVDTDLANSWVPPGTSPEDLAVLQYTSGSTGRPKGVMLSHRNLLLNLRAGREAYGIEGRMNGVFWLPPYHDMGLIGGILMALFCGGRAQLFTPLAFLRDPLRWVRAMSHYGAYVSAAPNFAYEMCARAAMSAPEEVAGLDLSNWHVAISGAEPVRADTLDRFAQAFAPAGFRRDAFYPSFGLAENTLVVTANSGGSSVVSLDAAELEKNRAVEAVSGGKLRTVVGCGASADPEQHVDIVDPETCVPCPDGIVGEIWVSGGSAAQGYWNRSEESEATFRATIAVTGEGPYLRTGDVGFVRSGELFVTGRLKDLIILRGRNHYPHDLEMTAEEAYPSSGRSGRCVAFSVDEGGEEQLVLAVEAAPRMSEGDRHETAGTIRDRIGQHHEVAVHEIVFVPRGGIRRTSSGKLQRSAVRAAYLAGEYRRETRAHRPYSAPRDAEEQAVADSWGRALGVERVGIHDRFFELGGDSLRAVRVLADLKDSCGYELTLSDVAQVHTVEECAELIRSRAAERDAYDEVQVDLG
ncbi:AMP-binding protein [Streptomyces sp. Isolate_45]|uniref:AMP-binding protein n=1 Tax=Streptomyces sp. Isolate_45 TaxID=2950111 RepID=UPI002481C00E|nr:AMP-binding protein [Streptomyces sp. Isolate_45]MDA5282548.1 AMP-binding protein [Streptomyces sp. Isolate_45]